MVPATKKIIFLCVLVLSLTITGCYSKSVEKENTIVLKGESDSWSAQVSLNNISTKKDDINVQEVLVVKPKKNITTTLKNLTFHLSYNDGLLGPSDYKLLSEGLKEEYQFNKSGSGSNLPWTEFKDKIKYAQIGIEWQEGEKKFKEVIQAK